LFIDWLVAKKFIDVTALSGSWFWTFYYETVILD